jgi:hypothetical protein
MAHCTASERACESLNNNRVAELPTSGAAPRKVRLGVKGGCGRQANGTAGLPPAPEMPVRSGTYVSCHNQTSSGSRFRGRIPSTFRSYTRATISATTARAPNKSLQDRRLRVSATAHRADLGSPVKQIWQSTALLRYRFRSAKSAGFRARHHP